MSCFLLVVHWQEIVAGRGKGGGGQTQSLGMEVVVEGGVVENVEDDQGILGEGEQSVYSGLAVAIVAIEKINSQNHREHGAGAAKDFVLEGQLPLNETKLF